MALVLAPKKLKGEQFPTIRVIQNKLREGAAYLLAHPGTKPINAIPFTWAGDEAYSVWRDTCPEIGKTLMQKANLTETQRNNLSLSMLMVAESIRQ